jgi:hypothetical protein
MVSRSDAPRKASRCGKWTLRSLELHLRIDRR